VKLSTYSGKKIAEFKLPMKGGWGDYESPAIATSSEDIVIHISADGVPARLSAGDPRETKFLIQNLSFGYTLLDPLNDDVKTPESIKKYDRIILNKELFLAIYTRNNPLKKNVK
jgi:hypothetical protein